MRPARTLAVLALLAALAAAPLFAQEPLAAGSDGVPVPKKTKHVQPAYPAEALAQGIRGIVILEVVVGTSGKVESTSVIRSVPGLDEAAIAAARQWEYEPVKVDGKAVAVRLTVPITFALALPKIARDAGVPELRQGAPPAWPAGAPEGGGDAAAEVTLEPDGRIGVARITGGDEPWASALLSALKTWRFPPPDEDAVVSFRVSAEFVGGRPDQRRVELKASDLHKADLLAAAQPGAGTTPAAPTPAAPATVPPVTTGPPAATGPTAPAAAAPAAPPAAAAARRRPPRRRRRRHLSRRPMPLQRRRARLRARRRARRRRRAARRPGRRPRQPPAALPAAPARAPHPRRNRSRPIRRPRHRKPRRRRSPRPRRHRPALPRRPDPHPTRRLRRGRHRRRRLRPPAARLSAGPPAHRPPGVRRPQRHRARRPPRRRLPWIETRRRSR